MMQSIDLNADMGEYADANGAARERALMQIVSSCSIACGGHTGDHETMRATIASAMTHGVAIGAHPSYPDRENFGRQSLDLDHALLRRAIMEQLTQFLTVLRDAGGAIAHVKPHGALYNDAAKNTDLAALIAGAVKRLAPAAALMGPPDSALEAAAKAASLRFIPEGYIDRLYRDDKSLTPRNEPGAVLSSLKAREAQALAIVQGAPVKTSGAPVKIDARSLCIHSDSDGAVETAKAVRAAILAAGCAIEPAA